MPFDETTKRVRKLLLDEVIKTGRAPNVGRTMRDLGLSKAEVMHSLQELESGVCIVMEPNTENIRMLHPFANITTAYEVEVEGERKWYAE
jgi:hypothetical protein